MGTATEKDEAFSQGKNVFQQADEKRGLSKSDAARNTAFASGKNRFTLANEARNAALAPDAPKEETFEEKRAAVRARFWNRHPNSHVPLDPETEAARKAYLASRTEKPPQSEPQRPVQYDAVTMSAVLLQWQRDHANSYLDSPWNGEQFSECLADHLIRQENFSYALLDLVFSELVNGGHLEKKGPRMRGDFTSRSPQPYVRRGVTPEEQAELDKQRQTAEEVQLHADRTMPLSELQKRVRAGFRDLRMPDLRGTRV